MPVKSLKLQRITGLIILENVSFRFSIVGAIILLTDRITQLVKPIL